MKKIGIINNDESTISYKNINRKVVRGIGLKDGKILMIYSAKYGNYSFPGGGMKIFEKAEECLRREIKEETGMNVKNISKPIGYIDEVKMRKNETNFIQRTSYYFYAISSLGKASPERHERSYEIRLVDLDEALEANQKIEGNYIFVERETMILKLLKEEYYERIQNS